MRIYPWCLLALLSWTVYWTLFRTPVRRPPEVSYPRDGGLIFSDNNHG